MSKFAALNKIKHRDYCVRQGDFRHAATMHTCPVALSEFADLAAEYPILFVRSQDGHGLRCVALLGVRPGDNLFWQNNQWQGQYIPLTLRTHPFATAVIDDREDRLAICIDEESPLVAADAQRGSRLFDGGGEQTEYLANMTRFLLQVRRQLSLSDAFVRDLEDKALLEEQVILVKLPGGIDHRLTGVFRIEEKALNRLTESEFLALRERGYLPAIYAHLQSLRQVNNLRRLHAQTQRVNIH